MTIEQISKLTDFQKQHILVEDKPEILDIPESIPLQETHYHCCMAMGMTPEQAAARWEEVKGEWEA